MLLRSLCALILATTLLHPCSAQDRDWSGSSVGFGYWSYTSSWFGGNVPNTTDETAVFYAFFGGPINMPYLDSPQNVKGIRIEAPFNVPSPVSFSFTGGGLNVGSGGIDVDSDAGGGHVFNNSSIGLAANSSWDINGTTTINADISGGYYLSKWGTSTLYLGGRNAYSGDTYINEGTLQLKSSGRLPDGTHVYVDYPAWFRNAGAPDAIWGLSGDGLVMLSNNANLVIGNYTNSGGVGDYNGTIMGSGTLTKRGLGTWTLQPTVFATGFTGSTIIEEGTIEAYFSGLSENSSVRVDAGATLDVRGNNEIIALDGDGSLELNMFSRLQVESGDFSGPISGTGRLEKVGAGLLKLSGLNSYSGHTKVFDGTLEVATATGLGPGSGNIDVSAGATLAVNDNANVYGNQITVAANGLVNLQSLATIQCGTFDLAGANARINASGDLQTTVLNIDPAAIFNLSGSLSANQINGELEIINGTLTPNNNWTGLTTISGNHVQGSNATLDIQLAGTSPGSGYDQVRVVGDLTLDGALNLQILSPFTLQDGQRFTIIQVDGFASGQFGGFNEGAVVANYGGVDLTITYAGGDGNDVVLMTPALPPVQVDPTGFSVVRGSVDAGDLPELLQSDNQYLVMSPQFLSSYYANEIIIETSSPTETPLAIEFTLECKVANFVGTVDQRIYLFNYDTGQWEFMDNRHATPTDVAVVIEPNGDPTRFVQPGTGAMRAYILYRNSIAYWVYSAANLFLPYKTRVDQASWTITP